MRKLDNVEMERGQDLAILFAEVNLLMDELTLLGETFSD